MDVTQTGADRVARLAAELFNEQVQAMICTSETSLGYLHGFFEAGHERLLAYIVADAGRSCLICPSLSANHARNKGFVDVRPWPDGTDPWELAETVIREFGLEDGTIAIDDDAPAFALLGFQRVAPKANFVTGSRFLAAMTRCKDPSELDLMRLAAKAADDAYDEVAPKIRAGMMESEIEAMLSDAMRRNGGRPTFCIVATGPNGAEPHHHTGSDKVKTGDVLVLDFGCDIGGYMSDITRCLSIGEPDPEADKVYGIVLDAHNAARRAAKPGARGRDVDAAAREVIEDAGYGEFFVHRTGHGIGMRVHEEPYISFENRRPLEPGNCFSVEPGIYLPGRFGIRIENIVTATSDGCESLNREPPQRLPRV